jgi:hypothetical protein
MIDIDKLARESGASFGRIVKQKTDLDWWVFSPDEIKLFAQKVMLAAQVAEREKAKELVELARLYLDHYENYNITNHYQSDGDFTGFIAKKARAAIAKYEGEK